MKTVFLSKFSFGLMVAFGLLVLLQMNLYIADQFFGLTIRWNVFYYFVSVVHLNSFTHDLIMALFDIMVIYTAGRMLYRMLQHWRSTVKWNSVFRAKKSTELTERLKEKYKHWKVDFLVIHDESFVAITMGIFKPRIIVSTGLFNKFSEHEAEAILLHEWYHCRHYDPFKFWVRALLVDGMGYIPIIRKTADYYKTCKELLADRYSVQQMGTEFHLGSVLLKISRWSRIDKPLAGVSFADTTINYRIRQVLEPESTVRIPLMLAKPMFTSIAMLLLMIGTWIGGCR